LEVEGRIETGVRDNDGECQGQPLFFVKLFDAHCHGEGFLMALLRLVFCFDLDTGTIHADPERTIIWVEREIVLANNLFISLVHRVHDRYRVRVVCSEVVVECVGEAWC